MPTIRRFNNFRIDMYADDHPPVHFHIITPETKALVDVETLEVLAGRVPGKILREAIEWAKDNKKELKEKWQQLNG